MLINVLIILLVFLTAAQLFLISYVLLRTSLKSALAEEIALKHRKYLEEPITNLKDAYRFADDLKCYAAAMATFRDAYEEMRRTEKLVLPWPGKQETVLPDIEEIRWIWQAGENLSLVIEQKQEENQSE